LPAHSHLVATTRAKRLWTFVALAAVGVALVYAGISSYVRVTGKGTDFNVFYLAARTLAERPADLYHFRAPRGPTYTYIYPPTFAVLMRPVAALPLGASAITWSLLNIAFFLHGAWVLARALAPPPRRFDFLAWILVLGTPFAVENIFLGQVHGLIAYLMIRGVDRLRSGRSGAGAIWLAAAAAVKLIPAVFGLYFLVRRDWRGLASFALAGAVLTALPPAVVLGPRTAGALLGEFADMLVLPYVTAGASSHAIYDRTAARKTLHDQDFGALLTRLAGQDQDAARRALVVLSALLLAVSAAATWRRSPGARAPGEVEVACGIFTVLSLLLSPRNRLAYWTVLIIPWSVLVARLVGPPRHGAIRPIAAATLVVSASLLAIADPPVPTVQAMTLGFWGLSALWLGLIALAVAEHPPFAAVHHPGSP
jgi:hypothetical protein